MRVSTIMVKTRGRPRKFDEQQALQQATGVFWTNGYTGASLDDLSEAMGINRPSLYNAFGDKESIYRKAFQTAVQQMEAESGKKLGHKDLKSALTGFYDAAIDVYFSMDPPVGCFVFCTAPVEVINHPGFREDVYGVIKHLDRVLAERFREAIEAGDLDKEADPVQSAKLAQAVLHSIALRARAGDSKASLKKLARTFVDGLVSTRS